MGHSETHKRTLNSLNRVPLLTEQEGAKLLGLSVATLRRWRWLGIGPSYLKLGSAVRYSFDDLTTFIEENRRTNTSEAPS
jgi:hypothetical protein